MMFEVDGPLSPESDVCKALPVVLEKCVVDFVNGIDVGRDHHKHQVNRSAFHQRLLDGLMGRGARRRSEITARLLDAAEGSFGWLLDVTRSHVRGNLAIKRLNEALVSLSEDVSALAEVSAESRTTVGELVALVGRRDEKLEEWRQRTDAYLDAELQQNMVFAKWARGAYAGVSVMGRCYAALEELRWGQFGAFVSSGHGDKRSTELLDMVKDKSMQQVVNDAKCASVDERLPTTAWLAMPPEALVDGSEALEFLAGDHSCAPFVRAVCGNSAGRCMSDDVPRISSVKRMVGALTDEVLGG